MHFNVPDLDSYIDMLGSSDLWSDLMPAPIMDDVFYDACNKFLASKVNKISALRCLAVWLFYSSIKRKCFDNRLKIKLHPLTKGYAYMLDRGEIHILSDLLFKSTHSWFVSVLLHETAHVVLSQNDSYKRLLQLDVIFAERFFKDQHNEILKIVTPVEFYAQYIADVWTLEIVKRTRNEKFGAAMSGEVDKNRIKLLSAIETLNDIEN